MENYEKTLSDNNGPTYIASTEVVRAYFSDYPQRTAKPRSGRMALALALALALAVARVRVRVRVRVELCRRPVVICKNMSPENPKINKKKLPGCLVWIVLLFLFVIFARFFFLLLPVNSRNSAALLL